MVAASHIVTVLTHDQRGIIHRLVEVLANKGIPHIEISQTVVHGAFTIAFVIALPANASAQSLRDALSAELDDDATTSILALDTPLAVVGSSASADAVPANIDAVAIDGPVPARYILTAIGKGFAGVVREISGIVLEHGGNFSDFSSQVVEGRVQLLAEVELSDNTRLGPLQSALARASEHPDLAIRLQHHRLFSATNEIAFRRSHT